MRTTETAIYYQNGKWRYGFPNNKNWMYVDLSLKSIKFSKTYIHDSNRIHIVEKNAERLISSLNQGNTSIDEFLSKLNSNPNSLESALDPEINKKTDYHLKEK